MAASGLLMAGLLEPFMPVKPLHSYLKSLFDWLKSLMCKLKSLSITFQSIGHQMYRSPFYSTGLCPLQFFMVALP